MEHLSAADLKQLIRTVFPPRTGDRQLAILVDVPDDRVPDDSAWQIRRNIAYSWYQALTSVPGDLGLAAIHLFYYPNVHNNNADLPEECYCCENDSTQLTAQHLLKKGQPFLFREIFSDYQLFLAPTKFSTTAPLKLMARQFGFRAATMPGFSPLMIPALKLNYDEINRRVMLVKNLLDDAQAAHIQFLVDGTDRYDLHLDLRFRSGHASGGVFPEPGTAGNLPSGESYIVPYEGERSETSESMGILPVQLDQELVVYQIEQNKAVAVLSQGRQSQAEAEKIRREPAYANLAELGFGVLADFGIKPIGEVLLDEKLGLHIAFGRSDHFGGAVGAKNFSHPDAVEHTDRIYLPEIQNRVQIPLVELILATGSQLLMDNGAYRIF